MNLIEAVKSGKKFKRKNGAYYLCTDSNRIIQSFTKWHFEISLEDVLAEDWETEEKTVTITFTSLKEAIKNAVDDRRDGEHFVDTLARKLGLL